MREKEMEAEQLNVIPALTPALTAVGLWFKEQQENAWVGLSSFLLIQFMVMDWR